MTIKPSQERSWHNWTEHVPGHGLHPSWRLRYEWKKTWSLDVGDWVEQRSKRLAKVWRRLILVVLTSRADSASAIILPTRSFWWWCLPLMLWIGHCFLLQNTWEGRVFAARVPVTRTISTLIPFSLLLFFIVYLPLCFAILFLFPLFLWL